MDIPNEADLVSNAWKNDFVLRSNALELSIGLLLEQQCMEWLYHPHPHPRLHPLRLPS